MPILLYVLEVQMKKILILLTFLAATNSYALDFYKAKNTFENSKKSYSKESHTVAYESASRFPANINVTSKKTATK
jgi:hypothetical protein